MTKIKILLMAFVLLLFLKSDSRGQAQFAYQYDSVVTGSDTLIKFSYQGRYEFNSITVSGLIPGDTLRFLVFDSVSTGSLGGATTKDTVLTEARNMRNSYDSELHTGNDGTTGLARDFEFYIRNPNVYQVWVWFTNQAATPGRILPLKRKMIRF